MFLFFPFRFFILIPLDVGEFGCLASNRAGSITHQAKIGIIGQPYINAITDQIAVAGQTFSLQCFYTGYPIEEVYFVKGKRRLPFDERHLLGQNGRLVIAQIDKSDEGDYYCVVVGENGQRAQQSFRLNVVQPPVLSPFLFSDDLEEGTRATAVCSVVSGDSPITLQWLKDGQPLVSPKNPSRSIDPNVQVLSIKEFISSLIISNLTRRHQGVYTCLATTPNTRSNRTAVMRVKAPPKWLIKPSNQVAITRSFSLINDQSLLSSSPSSSLSSSSSSSSLSSAFASAQHLTESVRFDCLASGNPTPVIRWKFLRSKRISSIADSKSDTQTTESIPILSSPQIHVLENGSLWIRSIDKTKFEGIYLCEVSNGVGKPLEAKASLTINQLPQLIVKVIPYGDKSMKIPLNIHDQDQIIKLTVRHHNQVSLACTATGSIPLSIQWYKNGQKINAFDGNSVSSTTSLRIFESSAKKFKSFTSSSIDSDQSKQFGERKSNLLLKDVDRSDTARYVCEARNPFGTTFRMIILHVLKRPDAPESLKAIDVGSRTVTLTWSIGFTGNLPLLSQNIEYKKEAGSI
ncbi:Immunoglobulin domain containing protein 7 [Sarcoptes scabiei]|uniref:Immunoglobulin domain containing protein 7 n=1 Tax=Sarcoptes scabiei TaxID=52283 RepID=A0A132A8N9_SARSC|nr:Immunoglobulin domain containing protein 7 [Sarcoptes scabiei]